MKSISIASRLLIKNYSCLSPWQNSYLTALPTRRARIEYQSQLNCFVEEILSFLIECMFLKNESVGSDSCIVSLECETHSTSNMHSQYWKQLPVVFLAYFLICNPRVFLQKCAGDGIKNISHPVLTLQQVIYLLCLFNDYLHSFCICAHVGNIRPMVPTNTD